jgi:cytochrome o ubiquinol oxidase subunit 2
MKYHEKNPRAVSRTRISVVSPVSSRHAGEDLKRLRTERCFAAVRSTLFAALALLSGCDVWHRGFLNAQGPVAAGERHLFWIVVIVMLFVVGPVLLLTPLFAWHYRLGNRQSAFRPKWDFSWPLEALIWIPPSLIVAGLAVLLWHGARQWDPYTPVRPSSAPLEVQAVAFDWKWLFIYPESGVAAVNELIIPVGRPVHISLTSATVMQSLFIPALAGQIYAMGGMKTQLNLAADRPGSFLGENTQFNGSGYPFETFAVISLPDADFGRWIARLRASGAVLDGAAIRRLSAKALEPKPIFFSRTSPELFEHIVASVRGGTALSEDMR